MKIKHTKVNAKPLHQLKELVEICSIVRNNYDPKTCDCRSIAEILSEQFPNMKPVVVKSMIHDGAIQRGGHIVLLVEGTDLLIDATGDYANYHNLVRLKHDIAPWVYVRTAEGFFISQNHMPIQLDTDEKESEEPFTEWDILRLSAGPFYNELRAITV